jgi:hypothetical protein
LTRLNVTFVPRGCLVNAQDPNATVRDARSRCAQDVVTGHPTRCDAGVAVVDFGQL